MKIGYIGGIKHKNSREVITGYHDKELEWEVQVYLPPKPQISYGRTITITTNKEYETYLLKIIKKGGELKFFYVLNGLTREAIKESLDECWDLSSNQGYDFD